MRALPCAALAAAVCFGCPEEPTPVPPEISDIAVEGHGANVLSFTVHWTTDEPSISRVEFGEDGELAYYVEDTEPTTDHEQLVFGVHADSEVSFQIVALGADGTEGRSEMQTRPIESLPFETGRPEVAVMDEAATYPGWTLANLVIEDTMTPTVAVMFDQGGQVVWYHDMGAVEGRADVQVSLVEDERVLIGGGIRPDRGAVEVDLRGDVIWEGPLQPPGFATPGGMHHTFSKLTNDNYLTLLFGFSDGNITDSIAEIDPQGETVWTYDTFEAGLFGDSNYQTGNYAQADLEDDAVYFSAHMINLLFKIDRSDGTVLWALGEDGDFAFEGDHEFPWFVEAHAPEALPDGNLLVYDNGGEERGFSRAVEYEIDEGAGTAKIVWEYPGDAVDDDWQNRFWGDADRLPNGNTLMVAGSMLEELSRNRIFEVTPDGTLVWELWQHSQNTEQRVGSYQAERIPVLVGEL